MCHLLVLFFLFIASAWGQSIETLSVHVDPQGKYVQFEIVPGVFEKITDYLETHLTQHFFIEDGAGARYKGEVTRMSIVLASKRILFTGILDRPLPVLDQNAKVYLSIR